jgi:hypothetical protein
VSFDYSPRVVERADWNSVFVGIEKLCRRMRIQDVFSINLNGQQLTGSGRLTGSDVLMQFSE